MMEPTIVSVPDDEVQPENWLEAAKRKVKEALDTLRKGGKLDLSGLPPLTPEEEAIFGGKSYADSMKPVIDAYEALSPDEQKALDQSDPETKKKFLEKYRKPYSSGPSGPSFP